MGVLLGEGAGDSYRKNMALQDLTPAMTIGGNEVDFVIRELEIIFPVFLGQSRNAEIILPGYALQSSE